MDALDRGSFIAIADKLSVRDIIQLRRVNRSLHQSAKDGLAMKFLQQERDCFIQWLEMVVAEIAKCVPEFEITLTLNDNDYFYQVRICVTPKYNNLNWLRGQCSESWSSLFFTSPIRVCLICNRDDRASIPLPPGLYKAIFTWPRVQSLIPFEIRSITVVNLRIVLKELNVKPGKRRKVELEKLIEMNPRWEAKGWEECEILSPRIKSIVYKSAK